MESSQLNVFLFVLEVPGTSLCSTSQKTLIIYLEGLHGNITEDKM